MFILAAFAGSTVLGSVKLKREAKRVQVGYNRTFFGYFIKLVAGNPIMPLVAIGAVAFFAVSVFTYFGANNKGVEFFVFGRYQQLLNAPSYGFCSPDNLKESEHWQHSNLGNLG